MLRPEGQVAGLARGSAGAGRWAAATAALLLLSCAAPSADLRAGADPLDLQAAIDRTAARGGGVVEIAAGRTVLRRPLVLRTGVRVVGIPGKTVLVACDGARSALASDGDCHERQITLADPAGFTVGDGVAIRDARKPGGFEVTTAVLTERIDERSFRLSAPLYLDYMVADKASVSLSFPVIGGWGIHDASVEGITVEGNAEKVDRLDGCRGGGIYLFDSDDIVIRNCVVRHYNGDGISFQSCQRVTVEDCVSEGNTGLGLHPGSGSQHPVLRRNRSIDNGGDGLYVCWRVKEGVFEANEIRGNRGAGISIGHKDTDNVFRSNVIADNARAGVYFRDEAEPMGAHRNLFEKNTILDNGRGPDGHAARACVILQGHHDDVVFRGNTVGSTQAGFPVRVAFWVSKDSKNFKDEENRFSHLEAARELPQ